MTTTITANNVIFDDSLNRPSLTKGAIHVNDGTGTFQHIAPSADGQIIVSNTGAQYGIEWATGNVAIGFGVISNASFSIPAVGGNSTYFLNTSSTTEPKSVVIPQSEIISFSITPFQSGGINGWSTNPANITGGFLDFYYCYIPFSTQNSIANIMYYTTGTTTPPGTPDYQIAGTGINSTGTNFTSFIDNNIGLFTGVDDQVFVRMTNNLTTSGNPVFHMVQTFVLFKTT